MFSLDTALNAMGMHASITASSSSGDQCKAGVRLLSTKCRCQSEDLQRMTQITVRGRNPGYERGSPALRSKVEQCMSGKLVCAGG